jgi:hypothetical protein
MFTPNLVIGLAIAGIGVLLILERLGIANAMEVLKFWPIVLVLFGASVAAQSFQKRDPSLPPQKPVIGPGFVLFVLVMAMFATSGFRGWDWNQTAAASTNAERINMFGVMGSTSRTSNSSNFQSAHVGSVMGRTTLDLREANIAPGQEAVVDVFVAMGRATIRVPDGWIVDTSALPVMGSVEDERWPRDRALTDGDAAAPAPGPAPRLVLRGFVMMGKVEIQS